MSDVIKYAAVTFAGLPYLHILVLRSLQSSNYQRLNPELCVLGTEKRLMTHFVLHRRKNNK